MKYIYANEPVYYFIKFINFSRAHLMLGRIDVNIFRSQ